MLMKMLYDVRKLANESDADDGDDCDHGHDHGHGCYYVLLPENDAIDPNCCLYCYFLLDDGSSDQDF